MKEQWTDFMDQLDLMGLPSRLSATYKVEDEDCKRNMQGKDSFPHVPCLASNNCLFQPLF